MNYTKGTFQWMDLQIAVAIGICMASFQLVPSLQLLSACTAALMCSQDAAKLTVKSGATRLLTTALAGALGVGVVALDNIIGNYWVFIPLCMVGIVATLVGCRLLKVPPIPGRVGCVTFILVVIVASGQGRIMYAVHRLLATFYGAAVAVVVALVFAVLFGKRQGKEKNEPTAVGQKNAS